MQLESNPKVQAVFKAYPKTVKPQLVYLRNLILEEAKQVDGIDVLEETLKWGEPSYITKHGSTLRIDWKPKKPNQYAMYFKCTSKLVPTFKTIYKNKFTFEGNRAIVFKLDDKIAVTEIKHCILLALTYHKIKHLPQLGV